ncbi:MAG: hypothetical protein GEV08_25630 [Acidimicrobiia bacterium]|nr:hypothetical protein [Acidimicrobiia bacterium]
MSRPRRWDAPWDTFPPSQPLPVEGGVATRRQRGAMAATWWSRRFVEVLESYGLGARMQRGRRYARQGQVLGVDVTPGLLVAQVQGSRSLPYVVTARADQPSAEQWASLEAALRSQVRFAARLLAGEVPPELEGAGAAAGVALFPGEWADLHATCSCPDWENPCKHIAAVLYVFADQLDGDPWLLLAWRGRTREQVLAQLGVATAGARADGLPCWWPLTPSGPGAVTSRSALTALPLASPPTPPHRVFARLDGLEATVAGRDVVDLLLPAYDVLAGPRATEAP